MTFGSLFAGIGGFDLGFERAGMTCKWQVEINEYASQVLAKHWPKVRRHGDVCTWPQPDTETVDVICGGFPCQDISNAGKMAGITGDRSGLFFEIIRIARELGPKYIVLENVASLLGRGMGRVLGELSAIGFDAEWHCIPASHIGAPHRRDRIWIIAYSHGMRLQRGEHEREAERIETLFKAKSWGVLPASRVCRGDDGISNRMDRLKCLGNSIVPQVAEIIGRRVLQIELAKIKAETHAN